MNFQKIASFTIVIVVMVVGIYYYSHLKKEGNREGITITEQNDLNKKFNVIIKQQAELMAKAYLEKDFEKFSTYTYPKIIELFGSKEKYIARVKLLVSDSEAPTSSKISIGEPSRIINTGNELQTTIPQTLEIPVSGGFLVSISTLITLSDDNGKNWYFIDAGGGDTILEKLFTQFPNLSKDLIIPPKEKPVFYKK